MARANMTVQDKKWQAESDARALVEADIIKKTPGRLQAAKKEAKIMVVKAKVEAAAMAKVAKTGKSGKKGK